MRTLLKGVVWGLLLIGIACPLGAFELGVTGLYWFPTLDGEVQVDAGGVGGSEIDLADDLGVDDEAYPVVEVYAGFGDHLLRVSHYEAEYEGAKRIYGSLTFNGRQYSNTRVVTDLDYEVYDFMYQFNLIDWENLLAGASLGVVARVKLMDGSVALKSATGSEKVDFSAPIPMLGANFHMGILADLLEFRAMATLIGYSDNSVFDGQADVSFTPLPFVDIHGGYRIFAIDAEVDDVEFKFATAGPFVGITIGF